MLGRLSRRDLLRVAATLAISAAGGLACELIGLPAGWVAGGLLAVAAASLAGFNTEFPRHWTAPVFLVIGIYAGTGVSHETVRQMQTWPASFLLLGVAVTGSVAGSYWWLHGRHGWDRNDALLSSMPGALSFVIAAAEGLKADMKKVAISQSLRLIVLVEAIPLAAFFVGHPSVAAASARRVASLAELAILIAGGIVAGLIMSRLRLPGGWMIGGLFAAAALILGDVVDARLPLFLTIPCSIALGAMAGSRFRPGDLAILPHIARPALGGLAIALVFSGTCALAVTLIFGVGIIQTLLAFAPGALDALTILAFQLNVDPAYVAAHHVVRLVALIIAVPIIAKWLAKGA